MTTNKLWELYLPTEADEFRAFWVIGHNGDSYEDWTFNWFYPMALEHGMPEITDEQKQAWIDSNFGGWDRTMEVEPIDYPTYFATEYIWQIVEFFNGLFFSMGSNQDWLIDFTGSEFVYVRNKSYDEQPISEISRRAWYKEW